MKNYELTYLIPSDFSEEDLKNMSAKINSFIQEETGTLEKITKPFKKKLGYPIKKKEDSFLVSLNFSLDPDKLKSLGKKLKAENQILRYMILIKTPEKITAKKRLRKKPMISQRITEANKPLSRQSKAVKVELKEVDKKIEEMLKET